MTTATDRSAPPARTPRRWRRRLLVLVLVLGAYPAFVFGTVYAITLRSGLPGGRHGPRDAYRHCLASAIVAFTTSTGLVDVVTSVMEGDDTGASHRMDSHNNRVGAAIGADAPNWAEMLRAVRAAVGGGREVLDPTAIAAEAQRVVWLPRGTWRDRWF